MFTHAFKQLEKELDVDENFEVEFYAYNISKCKIIKKVYVLAPCKARKPEKNYITMNNKQIQMLSSALENEYLCGFPSERYSLFDISFRKDGTSNSIGFSFNDHFDYNYIKPTQVFKHFEGLGVGLFIDTLTKIQHNMFRGDFQYNSIFMIGMVVEDTELKSIKAYIRYDLDEAQNKADRREILDLIAETINPSYSSISYFSCMAEKLENINLKFSFVGVDCYSDKTQRYKVYFRDYEGVNQGMILNELLALFLEFGITEDVQNIFKYHKNGIWGIALSTDSFEYVDGVQLYFYP